jgi:predicted nucleic acid-binding protein
MVEGKDVHTSVLTLAEISDVYVRDGLPQLEERIRFIRSRGPILGISPAIAQRAASTKWMQRRSGKPLGLADALIYETANERGLELVTGDEGFQGLPGIQFIESRSR